MPQLTPTRDLPSPKVCLLLHVAPHVLLDLVPPHLFDSQQALTALLSLKLGPFDHVDLLDAEQGVHMTILGHVTSIPHQF